MTDKKRIQFIDLAKGVCILMVIATHITPFAIPGLESMRMPLYFILSGLFFKDYGGILKLILKKTNKILIPFIAFYFIGYAMYYAGELFFPGIIKTDANGITDIFTQRSIFNGPIWFLLALFWSNIIFCVISSHINNEIQRAFAVLIIGTIGVISGVNNIFLPCDIDCAMSSLPFFYIGYILKQTPLLYPNRFDKYNLLIALVFYLISFGIATVYDNPSAMFSLNKFHGNIVALLILSCTSVMSVLFLCKTIGYLPFISYMGRYSIIPLCTHHLIYRPIKVVLNSTIGSSPDFIVLILTILACWVLIPICKKYMPYITAQKDIIPDISTISTPPNYIAEYQFITHRSGAAMRFSMA